MAVIGLRVRFAMLVARHSALVAGNAGAGAVALLLLFVLLRGD